MTPSNGGVYNHKKTITWSFEPDIMKYSMSMSALITRQLGKPITSVEVHSFKLKKDTVQTRCGHPKTK